MTGRWDAMCSLGCGSASSHQHGDSSQPRGRNGDGVSCGVDGGYGPTWRKASGGEVIPLAVTWMGYAPGARPDGMVMLNWYKPAKSGETPT